jgi:hypothetical protein
MVRSLIAPLRVSIHCSSHSRENPGVQTEGETIQETMENFIDAFELFFRDELEGEIAKQSLDADRFEIEFAFAQR